MRVASPSQERQNDMNYNCWQTPCRSFAVAEGNSLAVSTHYKGSLWAGSAC